MPPPRQRRLHPFRNSAHGCSGGSHMLTLPYALPFMYVVGLATCNDRRASYRPPDCSCFSVGSHCRRLSATSRHLVSCERHRLISATASVWLHPAPGQGISLSRMTRAGATLHGGGRLLTTLTSIMSCAIRGKTRASTPHHAASSRTPSTSTIQSSVPPATNAGGAPSPGGGIGTCVHVHPIETRMGDCQRSHCTSTEHRTASVMEVATFKRHLSD